MRKLLLAVAMLLGVSSAAMAKAPLVLKSGTIQATVNGKVETFKAGDTLPEGADVSQLSATSDAVITAGGTTVTVPKGASINAGVTDDGMLDVRSNSGGALTVATSKGSATVTNGNEVAAQGNQFSSVAGAVSVKTEAGETYELKAGDPSNSTLKIATEHMGGAAYDFSATGGGSVASILPPPNPTQNCASTVSPSAPGCQ